MSEADYAAAAAELAGPGPFCVTAHEAPDGDALGSLLGCGLVLRAAGRDVVMTLDGEADFPEEYAFMPLDAIERAWPDDLESRTLIVLDCGSERRIQDSQTALQRARRVVNVDHHHDNTRFGDVVLVDAEASSSAEIVARLVAQAALPLPLDAAEALYVGLVTDTGRFQYTNTSPDALRLAADLVERGVHPPRVFASIWETVPFARQRLLGAALSRAVLEADGRLCVTWLTRADFEESGAPDSYADGVVDALRAVRGVDVAGLIRERDGGAGPRFKISLRARAGGVDVSAIARVRGGGGHIGAAGFSSDEEVDEIVAFLRDQVRGVATPA